VAKPKVAAAHELVQAVAIQKVAPVYPYLAKKYNVTGTVTLDIQISEAGRVTQAAAVSGPEMLRAAALAAVQQWRFKPASLNGNNVSSKGTVSIVFNTPR
jgi:protein TonB